MEHVKKILIYALSALNPLNQCSVNNCTQKFKACGTDLIKQVKIMRKITYHGIVEKSGDRYTAICH